jgi:hypothetical protein
VYVCDHRVAFVRVTGTRKLCALLRTYDTVREWGTTSQRVTLPLNVPVRTLVRVQRMLKHRRLRVHQVMMRSTVAMEKALTLSALR